MKELVLFRGYQDTNVTLGMLKGLPKPVYTLEEPWMHNKRNMSCIPAGSYLCTKHNGTRFKDVWKLNDVPNRTAILIHEGNTTDDISGCLLIGLEHGILRRKRAVLQSRLAMDLLRATIGDHPFRLTIKE